MISRAIIDRWLDAQDVPPPNRPSTRAWMERVVADIESGGDYTVDGILGQGGMGVVFRGSTLHPGGVHSGVLSALRSVVTGKDGGVPSAFPHVPEMISRAILLAGLAPRGCTTPQQVNDFLLARRGRPEVEDILRRLAARRFPRGRTKVAIKVSTNPLDRRFKREAWLVGMSLLEEPGSKHIIAYYDDGLTRDRCRYHVMEFVRNEVPLEHLPLGTGLTAVSQALLGLGFLHAHGVIHRDVKPDNILVGVKRGKGFAAYAGVKRQWNSAFVTVRRLEGAKEQHVRRVRRQEMLTTGFRRQNNLEGAAEAEEIAARGRQAILEIESTLAKKNRRLAEIEREVRAAAETLTPVIVKMADFGIAKFDVQELSVQQDSVMTASGDILGTPYFMSPEQARSARDVRQASDIYSIGTVVYRLATNRFPYQQYEVGSRVDVVSLIRSGGVRPVDPRAVNPSVSRMLRKWIACCMAPNAKDRYADAAEAREALDKLRRYLSRGIIGRFFTFSWLFRPVPGPDYSDQVFSPYAEGDAEAARAELSGQVWRFRKPGRLKWFFLAAAVMAAVVAGVHFVRPELAARAVGYIRKNVIQRLFSKPPTTSDNEQKSTAE